MPTTVTVEAIERVGRSYASAQYLLPSDEQERRRLEIQHRLSIKIFENRLYLVPVSLGKRDCVLDSGTGGGTLDASWVLDLATKVPSSVEIYGVDINSQLFPSDVAPNLHFRTSSITDLPLDWSGKFALFHQRYLISALAEKEWIQACAEAYRVVADGGWVNFQEILLDYRADAWNWEPGPATLKLLALTRTIYDARGFLMDISLRLPAMLREANFGKVHVEERAFSLAGSEGADMRNNFFDGFRAMKTPVLNADGLGYVGSEVEFDEMMEVVGKEWEETPNAKFQVYVVYAQKTI